MSENYQLSDKCQLIQDIIKNHVLFKDTFINEANAIN